MAAPKAVLDQINIVVGDVAAASAFYRLLGLDIDEPPAPWADHHRTAHGDTPVDVDVDSIDFASQWNRGWPGGSGVVIGFRVDSRDGVDALHAELIAAGHESQQAPYDAFWGARYAIVADPAGNAVGLMSPIDPAMRTAPPQPE